MLALWFSIETRKGKTAIITIKWSVCVYAWTMHAVIVIAILATAYIPYIPFFFVFSPSLALSLPHSLTSYLFWFPLFRMCVSFLCFNFLLNTSLYFTQIHTPSPSRSFGCVFLSLFAFARARVPLSLCIRTYLYFGFCFFYSSVALFRFYYK